MKLLAAAIQMSSDSNTPRDNLARADEQLSQAHADGARLAVLPEMFNTGYGFIDDYASRAESVDGPMLSHLRDRSRQWGMVIAAGFVEAEGHHLYDSLALCLPDGKTHIYRKQNLVFWEPYRFRRGRSPMIVDTPFGRVGLAICADMIYRRVWEGYRDRIDLAIVAAAWPDFACRESGRKHWLLGHLGPLASTIPTQVASDLGVPVVFANQCGETRSIIPMLGTWITEKIADQFAGGSCVADGRHGEPKVAGRDSTIVLNEITLHTPRRPFTWHSTSRSDSAEQSSESAPAGSVSRLTGSTAARVVVAPR